MSLKGKLYLGFIVVIFLAMVIAGLAIWAFNITNTNVDETNAEVASTNNYIMPLNFSLNNLTSNVIEAGNSYYAYIYNWDDKDFQRGDAAFAATMKNIEEIQHTLSEAPSDQLPTTRKVMPQVVEQMKLLDKTTNELHAAIAESLKARVDNGALATKLNQNINAAYEIAVDSAKRGFDSPDGDAAAVRNTNNRRLTRLGILRDVTTGMTQARLDYWRGVGLYGEEQTAAYGAAIKGSTDTVTLIKNYNTPDNIHDEPTRQAFRDIADGFEQYSATTRKVMDLGVSLDKLGAETTRIYQNVNSLATQVMRAVEKVVNNSMATIRTGMDNIDRTVKYYSYAIVIVAIFALASGLILATILIRNITNPINRIIDVLKAGSEQINGAAGQIASASQSLAEGSTTQAASLEETSSALEQMASMTRQNADNAQKTNETTISNNKLVGEGVNAMARMTEAMNDINDKSEKVSRIVKTIEDIAFQTNLLALNAAVEAARAGEAGKGFAVVADEVRNLSQRSAQAAKDTTELITGTVESVKNGSEIASQLTTSFSSIAEGSQKVGDLINQIAAATNEQAQGVDQVNTAVAQMDKVTQTNAANSEETASASEELSAQSASLVDSIGELVTLVSGRKDMAAATHSNPNHSARSGSGTRPASPPIRKAAPPARQLGGPMVKPSSAGGGANVATVSPSQLIPLEEGGFDDF